MKHPSSDATLEEYDQIVDELLLTEPDTTPGKMFGCRMVSVNGKAFCILRGDELIFKLEGDDHADALGLDGAHLFDPGGKGRPMREWVCLPDDHLEQWSDFAYAACSYVRAITESK